MRISDWSSDVCSSDLGAVSAADGRTGEIAWITSQTWRSVRRSGDRDARPGACQQALTARRGGEGPIWPPAELGRDGGRCLDEAVDAARRGGPAPLGQDASEAGVAGGVGVQGLVRERSEEHTSE